MKYTYETENTCSTKIEFEIDGDRIINIKFTNGCDGNLRAIEKLLDGCTFAQIIEKCKGNTCRDRLTSCTDQLAVAVQKAYEELSGGA